MKAKKGTGAKTSRTTEATEPILTGAEPEIESAQPEPETPFDEPEATTHLDVKAAVEGLGKRAKKTAKPAKAAKKAAAKKASKPAKAAKKAKDAEAGPSKKDQVLAMIGRKNGATLEDIMAATEWQKHTVRGFIAILGKKGTKIESFKSEKGERTYRVA